MKVNWYPLTSAGDESCPKLTPTLFAGLLYAPNRNLYWDLFCGGSSARLSSTSHAHKMDSRPGIMQRHRCKLLKLVDHYTYFGSNISSNESDDNIRLSKA